MTPANITALQALVQANPALAQQLQSATNEAATQLLARAASQKGLGLDAHAIADYLQASPTTHMTDAELEGVAGGAASGDMPKSTKSASKPGGPKMCVSEKQALLLGMVIDK